MATTRRTSRDWVSRLRTGVERPISDEEKARRRAETQRILAFRAGLRSIAPETTGTYIDQIRSDRDDD